MAVFLLTEKLIFPDVLQAEPDGLLAVGGELSIERLLSGYSLGIFPWYSEGEPILWWSPDPRLVLFPDKFRISHSLRQKIVRQVFEARIDHDFAQVIDLCSRVERREQEGTWITEEMKAAYTELHSAGYAHSFESYYQGTLVGGLYGVSLGNAFFGESMFHLMTDASKVALYYLVEKAREFGFLFIDSQVDTNHMISLGAELIPRKNYLEMLDNALKYPTRRGNWI